MFKERQKFNKDSEVFLLGFTAERQSPQEAYIKFQCRSSCSGAVTRGWTYNEIEAEPAAAGFIDGDPPASLYFLFYLQPFQFQCAPVCIKHLPLFFRRPTADNESAVLKEIIQVKITFSTPGLSFDFMFKGERSKDKDELFGFKKYKMNLLFEIW